MATIPAEKIDEIRDRIDIASVIGRTVDLRRQGHRLTGCCPFHQEKTPSFSVDPVKKLFHCFGCGVGGDVFGYVMRHEAVEFPEAVRILAREAGVQLPEREESPAERRARQQKERMYRLNEIARDHYRSHLSRAPRAQAYLRSERGLTDEIINAFQLGWAEDSWDDLAKQLQSRSVPEGLAVDIGLLGRRSRGGVYDRLRGKIIFPIALPSGDIAGFGARRADWIGGDDPGPKYLNSSESPVYDKSRIFYGMDRSKDPIRRGKRAILVEGYFDVIALHQAGLPQAVACCGTALSKTHAQVLTRYAGRVITLYDGDTAGVNATRKAAQLLLAAGADVSVLFLPDGEDPDTYVRRHGAEALDKKLDSAPSAIDAFLEMAIERHSGAGVAGLVKTVDEVKPLLMAVKDREHRALYAEGVARRLEIDTRRLKQMVASRGSDDRRGGRYPNEPPPIGQVREARFSRGDGGYPPMDGPPPPGQMPPWVDGDPQHGPATPQYQPLSALEATLMRLLVEDPDAVIEALEDRGLLEAFASPEVSAAVHAARQARISGEPFDGPRALESARRAGAADKTLSELRQVLVKELPERDELQNCAQRLLAAHLKRQLDGLNKRISRESNPELIQTLMVEAQAVAKRLGEI